MGQYIFVVECIKCQVQFTCNPKKVPSIRIDGIKQPLCEECVTALNELRIKANLDPWPILKGAYDYVIESDLGPGDYTVWGEK